MLAGMIYTQYIEESAAHQVNLEGNVKVSLHISVVICNGL